MEISSDGANPLFKTKEGEIDYYKAYDATLSLWPVPAQENDIPTRFGSTHLVMSGNRASAPLVLFHGAQASSTMWFPNIAALSNRYCVYAVDFLLEAGKSVPARLLSNRQDLSKWILDVLDCCSLHRPAMVGMSRGGWNAVAFALDYPKRVDKLVLLSPAQTITPIRNLRFLAASVLCSLFPADKRTMRMVRLVSWDWRKLSPLFLKQYGLALRHFRIANGIQVPPTLFSDQELHSLSVPILLMIGDHDIVNNQASLQKARRLMPNITAELVTQAGHLVSMDQPEYVNNRIIEFLST